MVIIARVQSRLNPCTASTGALESSVAHYQAAVLALADYYPRAKYAVPDRITVHFRGCLRPHSRFSGFTDNIGRRTSHSVRRAAPCDWRMAQARPAKSAFKRQSPVSTRNMDPMKITGHDPTPQWLCAIQSQGMKDSPALKSRYLKSWCVCEPIVLIQHLSSAGRVQHEAGPGVYQPCTRASKQPCLTCRTHQESRSETLGKPHTSMGGAKHGKTSPANWMAHA